jgi:serine/threonine protein phosphatase 1
MSKTFVIADIHGRLDLLELALAEISNWGGTKVIFTGDFIDRGPDSSLVVQRLMDGPDDGSIWSFVRGNHEDMALHCADGTDLSWWVANGGGETIASYGGEISAAHLDWFNTLPRLTWDKHRVYVHAGVLEQHKLEDQPEQTTQWHRYSKGEDVGHRGRHVVHGHTPIGPELLENRTNLDAGSFFSGQLSVGVFDDDIAGGPVDLIHISAPTQPTAAE